MHIPRSLSLCWLAVSALVAGCAVTPAGPGADTPAAVTPTAEARPAPNPAQIVVSPAETQAMQATLALQNRLYRVAAPLMIGNTELCRSHARSLLGFRAKNRYSFAPGLADAAQAVLGVNERLRVTDVLPGSGAAKAGLMDGDILVSAEGKPFPTGPHAERDAATLLGPLMTDTGALRLTVLRGEQEVALQIPPTEACAFNVEVGNTDLVNAYGDGFRILLTRGMIAAVRDDQELAYVVAREMAHNMLGHPLRMNQQATAGGIIDNLARPRPDLSTMSGLSGLRPMPPSFDVAADRLSVYLLARAGYKLDGLVPFWRRMATTYPTSIPNAYSALHPATERRIATLEQAVRDVRARRAAGRPLRPAP